MRLLKLLCCFLVFVCLVSACELIEEKEIVPAVDKRENAIRHDIGQQEIEKSSDQSRGGTNPFFNNIGFGPSEVAVMETDSIN